MRYLPLSQFAFGLFVILSASVSHAQLPQGVLAAPDANKQLIEQFVDGHIAQLQTGNATSVSGSRNALITQAAAVGAGASFYDVYTEILNRRLTALASNKEARVRLNAAIVNARVAAKAIAPAAGAPSLPSRLNSSTSAFLKDSSDAVVLWGLQAAKYVIPADLSAADIKGGLDLGKDALQAAKDHNSSESLVEEAYRTLTLNPLLGGVAGPPVPPVAAGPLVGFVPYTLDWYDYRVQMYQNLTPPAPIGEIWGSLFFIKKEVWAQLIPQQQQRVLQLMMSLVQGSAKQFAAGQNPAVLDVIKRVAGDFIVFPEMKNSKAATNLARAAGNVTSAQIDADVAALESDLRASGLLKAP